MTARGRALEPYMLELLARAHGIDDGSVLTADPLGLEGRPLYALRARLVTTESTVVAADA